MTTIAAAAIPSRIADVNEEYILSYCSENNQLDWYVGVCNLPSKRVKKDGTPCQISFFEVRNLFINKFMPQLMPQKKAVNNFRTRAAAAALAAATKGAKK